jgi:hypothetical protein
MKKSIKISMLFLGMVWLLAGCEIMDDDFSNLFEEPDTPEEEKPKFVVTVNEMIKYPRATTLEREISTFSGRSTWINVNPFITSRNIKKIILLPCKDKPDFYDLKVNIDRAGRIMWLALCEQSKIKRFGVVIDGVLYRRFEPERLASDEDDWAVIRGPFDKSTAEALKKAAPKNYKIMNGED